MVSSTRQDVWTAEEDELLTEIVLNHIKSGSTQLNAFEEVGRKLSRTAAACGFRWNSYVRKINKEAIELAKNERKHNKKQAAKLADKTDLLIDVTYKNENDQQLSFDKVIEYLNKLYGQVNSNNNDEGNSLLEKVKQLEDDKKQLLIDNQLLKEQLETLKQSYSYVEKIIERARHKLK